MTDQDKYEYGIEWDPAWKTPFPIVYAMSKEEAEHSYDYAQEVLANCERDRENSGTDIEIGKYYIVRREPLGPWERMTS